MKKATLTLITPLMALFLFTGCVTSPDTGKKELDTVKVAAIVKEAAKQGSAWDLDNNPEHKRYYVTAVQLVAKLLKDENYDRSELARALADLPIRQLQSESGALIIGTAVSVYDVYADRAVDLDKVKYMKPIIQAIHDGLQETLDTL